MDYTFLLPPLTTELIDEIVFGMENQDGVEYLDTREGCVVPAGGLEDSEALIPLPAWTSADGYNLMQSFVPRVRDAEKQKNLRSALARGKGVFRAFKDVVESDPLLSAQWHAFKDHEMEKVVLAWWRDLKRSGREEREDAEGVSDDMLLENVSVEESADGARGEDLLAQLAGDARLRVQDVKADLSARPLSWIYALGPGDEVVGLVAYSDEGDSGRIRFYGVAAEWRGLGLFRLLLASFARSAKKRGWTTVTVDVAGKNIGIADMLRTLGPASVTRVSLSLPASCLSSREK